MIISHKHKFVFIAVTKTGGTTIRNMLNPLADVKSVQDKNSPYEHHTTAHELKKHFKERGWNWDEYFSFAFVRNPWDRLVSNWNYKKKSKHMWEKYNEGRLEHYLMCVDLFEKFKNFKEYLNGPSTLVPCTNHTQDENGNNLLDFIGRFENLQEDFNLVCDKIGIPRQELPHKNKSKHKHYTEYYDDETREIVAEKYAKDIEYFGYEFGE
jgi:chondroitin 4-sulfotransferase 11